MWETWDYSHDGPAFTTPVRNVLPKPYGGGQTHPPMWVAAGNLPTYAKAAPRRASASSASTSPPSTRCASTCSRTRTPSTPRQPVGQFVNDNVMIANGMVCLEDGSKARELACNMKLSYLQSLTFLYHDTFPMPEGFKRWPEHIPEPTMDDIEQRIEAGFLLCGDPDEVTEQLRRYEEVGCDQVSFGMPLGMCQEQALESIRLFGERRDPEVRQGPGAPQHPHAQRRVPAGEVAAGAQRGDGMGALSGQAALGHRRRRGHRGRVGGVVGAATARPS